MRFVIVLLFPALAIFQGCANAPGPDISTKSKSAPQLPAYLSAFVQDYTKFFADSLRATHTPGAALVIVKDSQIVFVKGYGPRVYGGLDSIDAQTVFRIGSLSKGFAGILTGILVQDSVLRWDDRVQEYCQDFTLRDEKQASRIQLWHLLSHTTGLPYHACTNLIERGFSVPKIVTQYLPAAPICGKEGDFFAYQNVALCIIEEVMKQKTGDSYQKLLTEKIFLPAGMKYASCDYFHMSWAKNKTYPHLALGDGNWRADSISTNYYNSAAAGGVNASIADMGEWLKVLLGHRHDLVADSTLERVFHPVVKTDKERRIFPHWLPRSAASYALGWRVLDHDGDTIVYHGGYVNGYRSEIALNRKDGIGICVLFNANTPLSSSCIPTFFEKWEAARLK